MEKIWPWKSVGEFSSFSRKGDYGAGERVGRRQNYSKAIVSDKRHLQNFINYTCTGRYLGYCIRYMKQLHVFRQLFFWLSIQVFILTRYWIQSICLRVAGANPFPTNPICFSSPSMRSHCFLFTPFHLTFKGSPDENVFNSSTLLTVRVCKTPNPSQRSGLNVY